MNSFPDLDRLIAREWKLRVRGAYTAVLDPPPGSWSKAQHASGSSVHDALTRLNAVMAATTPGEHDGR